MPQLDQKVADMTAAKVFPLTIRFRFGYFRFRFIIVFSCIFVSVFVFVNEFNVFSLTTIFVFVFVNEINTAFKTRRNDFIGRICCETVANTRRELELVSRRSSSTSAATMAPSVYVISSDLTRRCVESSESL